MKWPLGETHVAAGASLPSPPPRGPRNCLRHMERTAFGEADAAAGLGRWVPAGAERGRFPIIFNCQTLSQLRLPPRAGAPPATAPPGMPHLSLPHLARLTWHTRCRHPDRIVLAQCGLGLAR